MNLVLIKFWQQPERMYVIPSLYWSGKPLWKQKQDFLKAVLLLRSLAEATILPALRQPCPVGRGWKNNMRGWQLVLSFPQSIHLLHRGDTGRGRATQGPANASVNENNSTFPVPDNMKQVKTIKTIKQFVGFRGIKMSNWRLTTPTQGHFSKLSRDYQECKAIQIKAPCEQRKEVA